MVIGKIYKSFNVYLVIKRVKMERSNKIIVVLLVLAILFAVVSIAINLFAANITIPEIKTTGQVVSGGSSVNIIIEGNNVGGGG
jgi:uncharacterized membrane protein